LSQKGERRSSGDAAIGDKNRAGRARVISRPSLRISKTTRKNRELAALGIDGVEPFLHVVKPPRARRILRRIARDFRAQLRFDPTRSAEKIGRNFRASGHCAGERRGLKQPMRRLAYR
jgi:hypothetical protein